MYGQRVSLIYSEMAKPSRWDLASGQRDPTKSGDRTKTETHDVHPKTWNGDDSGPVGQGIPRLLAFCEKKHTKIRDIQKETGKTEPKGTRFAMICLLSKWS
jgi:hypothetical protein